MRKRNGIYLTTLFTAVLLWFFYSDILLYPENFLFDSDGDGIKNYFNFSYHIKYDQQYWQFGGMNNPYGEYLPYVDCHPALAIAVKWVSENAIDLSDHTFGFLNFVMFSSIVGCSLFLYLVLLRFHIPYVTAIFGATAISVLSSQVLLWQFGHYALSHSLFFPMGWYLLLRFREGQHRLWWSILIAVNTVSWFFIHTYLGFMLLAFTFLGQLFYFLFHARTELKRIGNLFFMVIQVAIPVLVVYYVMVYNDTHGNRIEMPFLTDYRASVYSIFFPNHSFLRPLYELFVDLSPQAQQSWGRVGNYIGLPSNLVLVSIFILTPYLLVEKRKDTILKFFPASIMPCLLAATLLLLYAMAIPLQYGKLARLTDLLPPLKQFVALGRFAWPFYYVVTVYTLVLINTVYQRGTANILLFLTAMVYLLEGASYHRVLAASIAGRPNFFKADVDGETSLSGIGNRYDFINYQAIIPLPFFHKYTTPTTLIGTDRSEQLSMRFSYLTGLPLTGAALSRPSLAEGKNIVQLFAPPYYQKPVRQALTSSKPFLVLYTKEPLQEAEAALWAKVRVLVERDSFVLGSLSQDALFNFDPQPYRAEFEGARTTMKRDAATGWYLSDSTAYLFYDGFDDHDSEVYYQGGGAYRGRKDQQQEVFRSPAGIFSPSVDYSLSFWYYNHGYDQSFNSMWLEERDSRDSLIGTTRFDPIMVNITDGDWCFNDIAFQVAGRDHYIVLNSGGRELFSPWIYIDELLVRPRQANVFGLRDSVLIRNNEFINLRPTVSPE